MTGRRELLREALVERAGIRRPSSTPRVVAALAAIALAGAATGGGVSAAAFSGPPAPEPTGQAITERDVREITGDLIEDDTNLYASALLISGTGTTTASLGERPVDATMLLIGVGCRAAGTDVQVYVDGEPELGVSCDDAHGGSGGRLVVSTDGEHELRVEVRGAFLLWAQWASETPTPDPSVAQQAEIADGVITWDEYQVAFLRYAACSEEAGYPLPGYQIFQETQQILYGPSNEAVDAGADRLCYAAEFQQADIIWQLAHPRSP